MLASPSRIGFQVEATSPGTRARAARYRTLHNEITTPIFMPVGTQGALKGQRTEDIEALGAQIILANTYHMLLRPGVEVLEKLGGLHKMMNWPRSILTDSGGFQIFSLENMRKMSEEGATFRSHIDGRYHHLSPESSIAVQRAIGSDIWMVLDQCVPSTCDYQTAFDAMNLTHRWAKRSLAARGDSPQALFAIVQGACFEDLRRQSADALTQMPFDGFAIGGLAVGETKAQREDFCELTASLLPSDRPRYLMGVGTPIDLLEAVHRGVDMFDCIIPTALAQQGVAFTSVGKKRVTRAQYRLSDAPLDPNCACPACTRHPVGYLYHLIKANEPLGWQLLGLHNIRFYLDFMRQMRERILAGTFLDFYTEARTRVALDDGPGTPPPAPRRRKKLPAQGAFSSLDIRPRAEYHGPHHGEAAQEEVQTQVEGQIPSP